MPNVEFDGQTVECQVGDNLRKVLLKAKLPLYNGLSKLANCRGFGTCGTCAVEIDGDVTDPTTVESLRLKVPPHKSGSGLRLACQCKVKDDLKVTKHGGMWGSQIADPKATKPTT
ncbi:MAG: 2Fe-2S iron-sulfur cluster binding domain-containing protein [Planctomycetota bacterium]